MFKMLEVEELTHTDFADFGDVVEFEGSDSFPINNGMAQRYDALAKIETSGPKGRAVISLVISKKYDLPREVDHLECHPLGSQAFLPLDEIPFIVVVGKAAKKPSVEKLRAFVTNGRQGINYHKGTWHHVLLTPFAPMRFICVDRAGEGDNCIDFQIPTELQYEITLSTQGYQV